MIKLTDSKVFANIKQDNKRKAHQSTPQSHFWKFEIKRNLQSSQKKDTISPEKTTIKIIVDIVIKIYGSCKAIEQHLLNSWKGGKTPCQPRFPYPVNIFLSNEGEINICSDKMWHNSPPSDSFKRHTKQEVKGY